MTVATREPNGTMCIVEGENDCDGPGTCHGPMCWCDNCGDVDAMCDCDVCDQHQCCACRRLLTHAEHEANYLRNDGSLYKLCDGCHGNEIAAEAERFMLRAERIGDEVAVRAFAAQMRSLA